MFSSSNSIALPGRPVKASSNITDDNMKETDAKYNKHVRPKVRSAPSLPTYMIKKWIDDNPMISECIPVGDGVLGFTNDFAPRKEYVCLVNTFDDEYTNTDNSILHQTYIAMKDGNFDSMTEHGSVFITPYISFEYALSYFDNSCIIYLTDRKEEFENLKKLYKYLKLYIGVNTYILPSIMSAYKSMASGFHEGFSMAVGLHDFISDKCYKPDAPIIDDWENWHTGIDIKEPTDHPCVTLPTCSSQLRHIEEQMYKVYPDEHNNLDKMRYTALRHSNIGHYFTNTIRLMAEEDPDFQFLSPFSLEDIPLKFKSNFDQFINKSN